MLALAMLLAATVLPGVAAAQAFGSCNAATGSVVLPATSSLTLATQGFQGSGGGGLSCNALSLLSTSYIRLRVDSSTFRLTGPSPGNALSVPFTLHPSATGAAMGVGSEFDYSATPLLALFIGPGASVPLYVRTQPAAALRPGTYQGSVTLRWYFSICTLGVLGLCTFAESPGFVRAPLAWGSGVPVTLNISLVVNADCAITAPALDFGSAPMVASFNPVTRTISIRCSAGSAYTVGLGDGQNPSGGWRRMRRGLTLDYLRYQIYKGPAAPTARWGSAVATERRSSATADGQPGVYDGTTLQQFTYRAVIDPTQATPPAGTYLDTVLVDVQF